MANQTLAPVIRKNNMEYDTPKLESVPCGPGTVAESVYWRIPVMSGLETLVRYDYKIAIDNTPPTLDSNKVVRVRDNNTQNLYWIVIASNANAGAYNSKCDTCCGNSSDMAVPTYNYPVIEQKGVADAGGNYNYFAFTQALGASQAYSIKASVNGAFLTPAAPGAGFASLAAMKTWLLANWAAAGTWDVVGTKVTLVSTTAKTASIEVTIIAV